MLLRSLPVVRPSCSSPARQCLSPAPRCPSLTCQCSSLFLKSLLTVLTESNASDAQSVLSACSCLFLDSWLINSGIDLLLDKLILILGELILKFLQWQMSQ
ncbi:hypothetical protein S83_047516 [Arachis hypogaea]